MLSLHVFHCWVKSGIRYLDGTFFAVVRHKERVRTLCHLAPEQNGDKMKIETKQINSDASTNFDVRAVHFVLFNIHTNSPF